MKIKSIPNNLSPVTITGGKSKALPLLHKYIPDQFEEYREPFIGAGSMALSLMWLDKKAKYWINDLDWGTFNFWNNLHQCPAKMQKWVAKKKEECLTTESFQELYTLCKNNLETAGGFEAGCMFFILNKLSFNGHGTFVGNNDFTDNAIKKIDLAGKLLRSVNLTVTNFDYSVLLTSSSRKTFVFLDPPYDLGSKYIYRHHKDFKHDLFGDEVKECPHQWMMTYNNIPSIAERYQEFNPLSIKLFYATPKKNKIGTELLIKNYETN